MREGEKGRDGAKPPFFTLPNGPLHFVTSHSRFALASFRNHAKNEAPEEEAGSGGDTRLYMPLNMKSMAFLLQFFESFRGKINEKYSTGNEEWIKSETATITSDYVVS